MKSAVGMIGLGIMGSAMASNLMRAGFRVVGHDVVPKARAAHRRAGGIVARSNGDVARRAPIVVTSLPSAGALETVVEEIARARPRDLVVVETSTLPLDVKHTAQRRLAQIGVTMLDCPLSGTGAQARAKDLLVYASGPRAAYKQCTAVFEGFARGHHYVGKFGNGSRTKYVANLLVAIHNVAAAEALVLAKKSGLDPALTLRVVADGAGGSRMLQVRGPSIVKDDYSNAMITIDLWQKDMKIIGEFARELGCATPLFAATAPLYTAAIAIGHGQDDTAAVGAVLGAMAGLAPRRRRRLTRP
ncbi:MAG TPA: NAD(P)-dependent oxidoreductase [Burkholderiales bacterium]|nr:NAD(P)-dependent oxidoreductase [Burkholderiales bacterium]